MMYTVDIFVLDREIWVLDGSLEIGNRYGVFSLKSSPISEIVSKAWVVSRKFREG